jgi:excisionase family DNA binding protein
MSKESSSQTCEGAPQLCTKADIAAVFQVGTRTVENWMQHGKIPFIRMGQVVRFSLDEVLSHVEQHYLVRARQSPLRSRTNLSAVFQAGSHSQG